MKHFHCYISIALFILLNGCKQDSKYVAAKATLKLSQNIKLDTSICEIQIDSSFQFYYKKVSANIHSNILCCYNAVTNSLDFFDLNTKSILSKSKIPSPSLDIVNNVYGIFYHNQDSIFIMSRSYITMSDSSGKLKKIIPLNSKSANPYFKKRNIYDWDTNNNLFFQQKSNQIYAPALSINKPADSKDYYSQPILVSVDMNNNNFITEIPISYSPLYRENYFGFMNNPAFTYLPDNRIISSFPIEPNLYIYDPHSTSSHIAGGAIDPHNAVAEHLDWSAVHDDDKKLKHDIENVNYTSFLYDPIRKLYYRLQYDPLPRDNRNSGTQNDRKQILTVFNNKLEIIAVTELNDRRYFFYSAFVTKDGLYIPAPSGKNSLRFKIYKYSDHEKSSI